MNEKKSHAFAGESLACFALAVISSIPVGGHSQSVIISLMELVFGWELVMKGEQFLWILPRTLLCLAIWLGFRSFYYSDSWKDTKPLAAATLSVLSIIAGVIGILITPDVAH